jgi:hypothetical protein
MAASESDDRVCAGDSPEHARLFEAGTDYGFTACLDDAGANEQVLTTVLRIAHTVGISLKIIRFGADLVRKFGVGPLDRAQRKNQLFDFAFIEQPLLVKLNPGLLLRGIVGV